jgi:hypothetical protein
MTQFEETRPEPYTTPMVNVLVLGFTLAMEALYPLSHISSPCMINVGIAIKVNTLL